MRSLGRHLETQHSPPCFGCEGDLAGIPLPSVTGTEALSSQTVAGAGG